MLFSRVAGPLISVFDKANLCYFDNDTSEETREVDRGLYKPMYKHCKRNLVINHDDITSRG